MECKVAFLVWQIYFGSKYSLCQGTSLEHEWCVKHESSFSAAEFAAGVCSSPQNKSGFTLWSESLIFLCTSKCIFSGQRVASNFDDRRKHSFMRWWQRRINLQSGENRFLYISSNLRVVSLLFLPPFYRDWGPRDVREQNIWWWDDGRTAMLGGSKKIRRIWFHHC